MGYTFFNVTCGVRQVYPIFPYLFLLCTEILRIAIRRTEDIQEFKIIDFINQCLQQSTINIFNHLPYVIGTHGRVQKSPLVL